MRKEGGKACLSFFSALSPPGSGLGGKLDTLDINIELDDEHWSPPHLQAFGGSPTLVLMADVESCKAFDRRLIPENIRGNAPLMSAEPCGRPLPNMRDRDRGRESYQHHFILLIFSQKG